MNRRTLLGAFVGLFCFGGGPLSEGEEEKNFLQKLKWYMKLRFGRDNTYTYMESLKKGDFILLARHWKGRECEIWISRDIDRYGRPALFETYLKGDNRVSFEPPETKSPHVPKETMRLLRSNRFRIASV
jgi:hypothetical protein